MDSKEMTPYIKAILEMLNKKVNIHDALDIIMNIYIKILLDNDVVPTEVHMCLDQFLEQYIECYERRQKEKI